MATLREIADIQADIDAAGQRGVTKTFINDSLESLADVQGVLSISNGAVNYTFTTSAWGPIFDEWTTQDDVKGVQEGPTPGTPPYEHYLIKTNGGGNYKMSGKLKGVCDTAGTIRIRPAAIRTDTTIESFGYNDIDVNVGAGGKFDLSFEGLTFNRVAGEKLCMQIRGPNTGIVTIVTGYLSIKRG